MNLLKDKEQMKKIEEKKMEENKKKELKEEELDTVNGGLIFILDGKDKKTKKKKTGLLDQLMINDQDIEDKGIL